MKKLIAALMAAAILLSLCACDAAGSSAGGNKPGGKNNAPESIIVNISDYVFVLTSNIKPDSIFVNSGTLNSVLRPYLKDPNLYSELCSQTSHIEAFATPESIQSDSVTAYLKFNKHRLETLRELVTIDIGFEDSVTIPLTGDFRKPENTKKIDWKDYFSVDVYGRNTEAEAEIRPNYAKILKDFAEIGQALMFTNSRGYRYRSAEACLIDTFWSIESSLQLDKRKAISNGDTLNVELKNYDLNRFTDMYLETEAGTMTKTVSGLPEVKPIDPFENLIIYTKGVHDTLMREVETTFLHDNAYRTFPVACEIAYDAPIHEGDTVKVWLEDWIIEEFDTGYFTRTEAEVKVVLPVLPNAENARLFLDNMTNDYFIEPAKLAAQQYLHTRTEVCGRLFYYNDNGRLENDPEGVTEKECNNNRLICIIKGNSAEYTGDWYTYVIFDDALKLYQVKNLITGEAKMVPFTQDRGDDPLNGGIPIGNIPTLFSADGFNYYGYKTLEEVLAAINSDAIRGLNYDHLIVSSELQGKVTER